MIGADDLPQGYEISTAADLIDLAAEAKVISL